MAYQTLEKFFYADASSERFEHHEREAYNRLHGESSFRTGIELENGELFLAVPRELSLLHERVLRLERRVSVLSRTLPSIALGAYIRSLILDEVVFNNEIEGVRSTRRQIEAALEDAMRDTSGLKGASEREHAPFAEFAQLYLNMIDNPVVPQTPSDVRNAYDAVVRDVLDESDRPDGELFRGGPVVIASNRGKTIHQGVTPESKIIHMLERLIILSQSEEIPQTYRALLCHFLFEYIHPFYDGNGRTGRYLLALHLSEPLSQLTVLSLSRAIIENKMAYHKAFDTVERPLNRSEATPFVITMLRLIHDAQEGLVADLEAKRVLLDRLGDRVGCLDKSFSERDRSVLFYAAQMHVFGAFQEMRATDVADYLQVSERTTRKFLRSLEERGLLEKVAARPVTHRLTEGGAVLLGIA